MRRFLLLALTVSALCLGTVGMAFASTPSASPVPTRDGVGGILCPLGGILVGDSCRGGRGDHHGDNRGGRYGRGGDTVIVTGGGGSYGGCAGGCNSGAVLVPSYGASDCNCGNSGVVYGYPQASYQTSYPVGAVATGDGSCYGRLSTVFRGSHFRGGRFH